MNIYGSPQGKANQTGADSLVGELIDDDKRAQSVVLGIRRKRHRPIETDVHRRDFV